MTFEDVARVIQHCDGIKFVMRPDGHMILRLSQVLGQTGYAWAYGYTKPKDAARAIVGWVRGENTLTWSENEVNNWEDWDDCRNFYTLESLDESGLAPGLLDEIKRLTTSRVLEIKVERDRSVETVSNLWKMLENNPGSNTFVLDRSTVGMLLRIADASRKYCTTMCGEKSLIERKNEESRTDFQNDFLSLCAMVSIAVQKGLYADTKTVEQEEPEEEHTVVNVKCDESQLPKKSYPRDAGYDLRSAVKTAIMPRGFAKIPTGVCMELPRGWEAQVRGRSGLGSKGVLAHLGTVDDGYRGDVAVILFNLSDDIIQIEKGDRVGQLVFAKVLPTELNRVEALKEGIRGTAGFGSTGK